MKIDPNLLSKHIQHLDKTLRSSSLPWEMANVASMEAIHVVASRYDRHFAANLFRVLATRIEKKGN